MQKGFVVITSTDRKVVAWTRIDTSIVTVLALSKAEGVLARPRAHSRLPGRQTVGRKGSLHTQDKSLSGRSHVLSSAQGKASANPCQTPTTYQASRWFFCIVLVGWGCHNKIPQMGRLKLQKLIFIWFWRLKSKIKVPTGLVSSEASLFSLQMAVLCVHVPLVSLSLIRH